MKEIDNKENLKEEGFIEFIGGIFTIPLLAILLVIGIIILNWDYLNDDVLHLIH